MGTLATILYFIVMLAITLYTLALLHRAVVAHEKIGDAAQRWCRPDPKQ